MDLWRLENICWVQFLVGYLYATAAGGFFIYLAMKPMREIIGHRPPMNMTWQPHVTGVIERTLYIMALLVGRPEIILAWPVFKVAGGWQVWGQKKDETGGKDDPHKGRAMFSNTFNGTALSIFYAFVGYLIAIWWNERAAWLAAILAGLTLALYLWLRAKAGKMIKKETNVKENQRT